MPNQKTQEGFSLFEVLVSALILSTFALMSLQIIALSAYSRVQAQIKTETDAWLSEDIANSKYLASSLVRDDSKCSAAAYNDGYAKALEDSINTTYPVNSSSSRQILGVDYNVQRTYTSTTAPHKVLTVTHEIKKWDSVNDTYTGDPSVAQARIEIMPDAALECP